MKNLIITLIVGVLCSNFVQAQVEGALGYYRDALLFSQTYQGGTARMQGIGGAQIALGGDISAGNSNPAGLGFFRRSTLTFTPSLDFSTAEANYVGRSTEDFNTNFNFGQLGIVFHNPFNDEEGDFKGGSFSITFTRINNFYNSVYLDARNDQSIIDSYIDRALGLEPDQLPNDLWNAYNHYLINPFTNTNDQGDEFTAYDAFVTGFPRQVERIKTRGKQNQWDFSYGGNYRDLIYFGMSAGVATVDYKQTSTYTESDFVDSNGNSDPALDAVSTQNILSISGVGVNSTMGIIVRPFNNFRFGFSAKTPTFYDLKDESSQDLLTEYRDYAYDDGDTTILLEGDYDINSTFSQFRLRTPWKLSFGTAFFFGKNGFISADIDYLDYSNVKIRSSDFNPTEDNQSIRQLYQSAINLRVGAEYRVGVLRIRAGYGRQGDPFASSDIDNSVQRISGGLGYRNKNVFLDLSAVHSKYKSFRSPYTFFDGTGPTASIINKNLNVSATVGFNF